MKISELQDLLSGFDGEEEILIAAESHDYWGTINAVDIDYIDFSFVGDDNDIYEEASDAEANDTGWSLKVTIHAA